MHFYPNFEIVYLIICFEAFVCILANENMFLIQWHFGGLFSILKFSVFIENGNFPSFVFLKIVSETFLVSHIIKLFQTANSKRKR